MITLYKKFALALSTAVLALATPNLAVAQSSLPVKSPQEIIIVFEFTEVDVVIVICGEDFC
jgi:hypothetical protein